MDNEERANDCVATDGEKQDRCCCRKELSKKDNKEVYILYGGRTLTRASEGA